MTVRADQVIAPVEGQVFSRNCVTTPERCTVPDSWFGRYVTFEAFTDDVSILFGDGSVSVTHGTRSTKSTEALVASAVLGLVIPAGQKRSFIVPKTYNDGTVDLTITSFAFDCSGTNGFWQAQVDSV